MSPTKTQNPWEYQRYLFCSPRHPGGRKRTLQIDAISPNLCRWRHEWLLCTGFATRSQRIRSTQIPNTTHPFWRTARYSLEKPKPGRSPSPWSVFYWKRLLKLRITQLICFCKSFTNICSANNFLSLSQLLSECTTLNGLNYTKLKTNYMFYKIPARNKKRKTPLWSTINSECPWPRSCFRNLKSESVWFVWSIFIFYCNGFTVPLNPKICIQGCLNNKEWLGFPVSKLQCVFHSKKWIASNLFCKSFTRRENISN